MGYCQASGRTQRLRSSGHRALRTWLGPHPRAAPAAVSSSPRRAHRPCASRSPLYPKSVGSQHIYAWIGDVPSWCLREGFFVDFSAVDIDSREALAVAAGDDREAVKLPGAVTFHAGRTSWEGTFPVRPAIVIGSGTDPARRPTSVSAIR
jgi:hypothetical protein